QARSRNPPLALHADAVCGRRLTRQRPFLRKNRPRIRSSGSSWGSGVDGAIERTADPTVGRFLHIGLALLSGGAGVVHLAVAGDHAEHPLLAAFFVATGVFQLAWAGALLVRPDRRV